MNMPGERNEKGHIGYKAFVISARILIRVLIVILFVVFVIFIARKAYSLGYEVSSYDASKNENKGDVSVKITMDMTINDVGNLLISEGIVNESLDAFLIQERLSDYHDQFIPGTYTLNSNMTIEEILEIISTVPDEEKADDN